MGAWRRMPGDDFARFFLRNNLIRINRMESDVPILPLNDLYGMLLREKYGRNHRTTQKEIAR